MRNVKGAKVASSIRNRIILRVPLVVVLQCKEFISVSIVSNMSCRIVL